jgi:molybdenum cofactor cytidylyltransferase
VIAVVSGEARLREALADLPLRLVINPHPERGLSSSIHTGLAALPAAAGAVLIAAGDLPFLEAAQVRRLAEAFSDDRIVVSRYGDRSGNPQVYARRFFAELGQITGDQGGRVLADLYPEAVIEVEFGPLAGEDVDTPADWERLRRLR